MCLLFYIRLAMTEKHSSANTKSCFDTTSVQLSLLLDFFYLSESQKGSTGPLLLTDEEKRTLLSEGYPVPQRLPLSKQEEKSLKKIRRKIKNKVSGRQRTQHTGIYMITIRTFQIYYYISTLRFKA